jgi:hypothetical protein
VGFVFEVDLGYPAHLHPDHDDYPLAPEFKKVGSDKTGKLIAHLEARVKYVVHYYALQLYLSLGMTLLRVHRVVKFEQTKWLEPYIKMNTEKRKVAKSEFLQDLFKLANNSVFGKTLQNVRKYRDFKMVNDRNEMNKLVSDPKFKGHKIFTENLILVENRRLNVLLNQPIYVGQAVLDISKCLMYDFHYNVIKKKFGNKVKLMLTDTDSLMYEIETPDVYDYLRNEIGELMDLSNFPNPDTTNSKVIGKFKDETAGVPIREFVGLRSKSYAFKLDEESKMKCKGIKKCCIKKDLNFDAYKQVLFGEAEAKTVTFDTIRSYGHQIYGESVTKVALTANDTKRIVLENGIDTHSYGYIEQPEKSDCMFIDYSNKNKKVRFV